MVDVRVTASQWHISKSALVIVNAGLHLVCVLQTCILLRRVQLARTNLRSPKGGEYLRREAMAGLTTFVTMSYIVAVIRQF